MTPDRILELRQRGRDLGHALITARCDKPLCEKLVTDELKASRDEDMPPADFITLMIATTGTVLEGVHNAAHGLDDLAGWRLFDSIFQHHLRQELACAEANKEGNKDK
jgi:hypothetical protein